MTATMVPVPGGEVWADDSGGDGPPLVLLHPGVGDSRFWDPILPALTAAYRVIRYDARGYGKSPAPTASYQLFADLVVVVDHYRLDRLAVAGCSQGGGSALALAIERPDQVSALVLLCPGVPGFPRPYWPTDPAMAAEYGRARSAGDVAAMAAVMQRVWAAAGPTPEVLEQLRSAALADLRAGDLEQPDPPVFDRLGSISVPTSLVVGTADFPPLIEADREAAARIPGCRLTVVPGMDHLPTLREPQLVLQTIMRTVTPAASRREH